MGEKIKLRIEEQIQDLKNKGVKFEIFSEKDATNYLKYQNYYFKTKSFAKNYVINPKNNQNVNLDFASLVELASLDMHIRKRVSQLCLDTEHYLKVRFLYDLSENSYEDGFEIIQKFIASDKNDKLKTALLSEATSYSISSDLAAKHIEDTSHLSAWNAVELLPFGIFSDLYNFYYCQAYPKLYKGRDNYAPYLKSILFLRNAVAHNNALLSSIKTPRAAKYFKSTNKLTSSISNLNWLKECYSQYKSQMNNPIIHDFIALLFVYNDLLRYTTTREKRNDKIHDLNIFFIDENKGRVLKNKEYFEKNEPIKTAYRFVSTVLQKLDVHNHSRKDSGIKLLQNWS